MNFEKIKTTLSCTPFDFLAKSFQSLKKKKKKVEIYFIIIVHNINYAELVNYF